MINFIRQNSVWIFTSKRNSSASPHGYSSSGSQTDIIALEPHLAKGRAWSSEPHLAQTVALTTLPLLPQIQNQKSLIIRTCDSDELKTDESIEELLVEARAFVSVAERKLVDLEDWNLIDKAKKQFSLEFNQLKSIPKI